MAGAIAFAGLAGLVLLLANRSDEVAGALGTMPLGIILALGALQATTYICRVSSWNVALRSAETELCPDRVRGVSGLAFTTSLVLPGYVGSAIRIGLLKRYGRSNDVGVGQMAMIDVLALAVEGAFLFVVAIPLIAIFAPGFLWLPLAMLGLMVAGMLLLKPLRAKLGHLSWARSLAVFGSRRAMIRFAAPLCAVVIINPLRFWIALTALGLNAGLGLAVVAFIIVTVVGALPIGGAQAGIGGLGVLFASHGTEVVVSAGVVLAATAALGALLCLLVVAAVWAARRLTLPSAAPVAA